MRDAGSGMSVVGHSLIILEALSVDLREIGLKQVGMETRENTRHLTTVLLNCVACHRTMSLSGDTTTRRCSLFLCILTLS